MIDPWTAARQATLVARRMSLVAWQRFRGELPAGKFPDIDEATFRGQIEETFAGEAAELVTGIEILHLPGDRPPWTDTGIDLAEGEAVTWLATGRVYLSRPLDVFVEADFQLWARIGHGPVFRGTRATNTFRADRAGRLDLACYFPTEWADETGRIGTPRSVFQGVEGGLTVAVIRWKADPVASLERLTDRSGAHQLLDVELDRLGRDPKPPEGWTPLWFVGPTEIYRDAGNGEVACRTRGDVGIVQHDVDVPLGPATRLAWSWKVDALPSALAEDSLPTHDYLSIAVEFENGIDLTYHWSAELAPETGYWCPLPQWEHREYHVVIRSGAEGLGAWIDEERRVYDDYKRFLGEPPRRIRRVWLIANSIFQRGEGRCTYRSIRLRHGEGETKVG